MSLEGGDDFSYNRIERDEKKEGNSDGEPDYRNGSCS